MKNNLAAPVADTVHDATQQWFKKPVLMSVFFIGLLLLSIISFVSYTQVQGLIRVNEQIVHTYDVIHAVNTTLYKLTELESDQRGYLISGQKHLLEDIDQKKNNLNLYLQKLDLLTKDNPQQNKRVLSYIELIEKRLTIFNQVTLLDVKNILHNDETRELFNHSQGLSQRTKALGKEIKAIEFVLSETRNEKSIHEANTTSLAIIFGHLLSIIILVIAFVLINIELTSRKRTESIYKHAQKRLQKILESSGDMIAAFDSKLHFTIFNDTYQKEFKHLFGKLITQGMSCAFR